MPATNAPDRMSRLNSSAIQTSNMHSSRQIRTPSWPLECRVRAISVTVRGRAGRVRQPGHQRGDRPEREENRRRPAGVVGRERQGDRDDRPDLAHRSTGKDVRAEARRQDPGIAEDRQERADRRRRQADRHETDRRGDIERIERRGGGDRHDERDHPSADGQLHRTSLHDIGIHLEAGEEDQEHEPQFCEESDDLVDLDQPEHVRPDEDPEPDLDHHARHSRPPLRHVGDERAEHRETRDQYERPQCLGLHDGGV